MQNNLKNMKEEADMDIVDKYIMERINQLNEVEASNDDMKKYNLGKLDAFKEIKAIVDSDKVRNLLENIMNKG